MEQKEETQTQAPLEFSNENLKVKIHFKPNCKVELEVQAGPSIAQAAHRRAVKTIGKEVTLPGFRKGKAPEALVEKNYPKQIDGEWQKAIADLAFQDSIKLINIPLLNNEPKVSYNMKSHSMEGSSLLLFFETEPTIPQINPKDITLKAVERPAVNDDKVNETMRQLQLFFAEWRKMDRPIQENDFVILDVDVIDEEPPRKLFADVRFEVTDRSMAKWMKELILGRHQGEILEGVSVPDEDASQKDKENLKPKKVRVDIKVVEEATVPEFTDEFARRLGAPSVDVMRQNVQQLLDRKADGHVQEKLREEVSDILLEKYPFDVPMSLIDREVRFRMQQLLQDQEYLRHWNSMTPEAKKRSVSSVAEQSQKAVRMFYLCRKILIDAKISISPKDLPKAPETPLGMLLGEQRDYHPQGETEVHQAEAFSRLLLEKAEDFIIANATIAQ
ncbi:MAG TPA: trigger factor [Rhabdochlamydiaceae bacterium]|nr:trigger factor [Rhabdochlamydiaceae bacterium]